METGQTQPGEEETEDLETPGMQGVQEEVSPGSAITVEKKDTSPEIAGVPRNREGRWNAYKTESRIQIIF